MIQTLFLLLIRLYQMAISPLFPPMCRHDISCSTYTYKMIQTHGPVKGGFMGIKRLSTCHPFHPGTAGL